MSRKIQFKKQYKPIGFGDPPDSRTVEGHRNAVHKATEMRRVIKELVAKQPPQGNSFMNFLKGLVGRRES
jgi:hypothetical protein